VSTEARSVNDTIASLRHLLAQVDVDGSNEEHRALVPTPGLFSDGLEALRTRVGRGELVKTAAQGELERARRRQRCLPGPACGLCANYTPRGGLCPRCSHVSREAT